MAGMPAGRVRVAGRRRPAHVRAAHGVSFSQVRAILRDSCEHCHNEETAEGSLVLKSYDTLIAGGESGNPIVPGKSASSLLVQAIDGRVKPRMPYKEDPLSAARDRHDPPLDRRGRAWRRLPPKPRQTRTEGRDSRRPAHRPCQRSGVRGGVRRHDATDCGRLVQVGPPLVRRRPEVERLARRPRRPGTRARVLGRWHAARRCRRSVRPRRRGSHLGRPAGAGTSDRDDSGTQGRHPQRGVLAGRVHHRHRQLRQAREVMGRGHRERAPHAQGALGRRLQRRIPARRDAAGLRGRRPDAEDLGRAAAARASSPSPTRSMPSTPWPFTPPARDWRRLAPIA